MELYRSRDERETRGRERKNGGMRGGERDKVCKVSFLHAGKCQIPAITRWWKSEQVARSKVERVGRDEVVEEMRRGLSS